MARLAEADDRSRKQGNLASKASAFSSYLDIHATPPFVLPSWAKPYQGRLQALFPDLPIDPDRPHDSF